VNDLIGSGNIAVNDTPNGREILRYPDAQDLKAPQGELLYDVVTIGGWTMAVAGWQEDDQDPTVMTVNGWFREQNHIFVARQTAAQVNAGQWAWGEQGDAQSHFAIAAILTMTDHLIPHFEGHWWNFMVPESILFARSWGENATGEAIVLGLTIGKIQGG